MPRPCLPLNVLSSASLFKSKTLAIAALVGIVGSVLTFIAAAPALAAGTGSELSQSVVASGAKVDLRTTLPFVESADSVTQELVQTIDPAKVRITGPSDVVAPRGWAVTYSTDGGASFQTTPTSWAAVNKVKATGPINGGGMAGNDAQIISKTNIVAMAPSVLSASGTAGDGWDVTFDNRGYVYNIYHHGSPSSLDCHLRSSGSMCPGWPSGGVTLPFTTNSMSSSFVDNEHRHIWVAANSSTQYVMECVDVSNPVSPALCSTPYVVVSPVIGSLGSYNEFDHLTEVNGYLFGAGYQTGKFYCFDYRANNGLGGACPSLPALTRVAPTTWTSSYEIMSLVGWGSRLYGYTQSVAYCFDAATWGLCDGWNTYETSLGSNPSRVYLQPSASGGISAVCFNPTGVCFTAGGQRTSELPNLKTFLSSRIAAAYGTSTPSGTKLVFSSGWANLYCYDIKTDAPCANWPDGSMPSYNIGYVYAVRVDPTNPNCVWTNEDSRFIRSFDVLTGKAGCASPSPSATFEGALTVPQMRCDGSSGIKSMRNFVLSNVRPGVDYTSANMTIKDSDGNVLVSGGRTWSDIPMTISGDGLTSSLDLSNILPADAGPSPSFIVNFFDRVSTKDVYGTVSVNSDAAQVCLNLTAVVNCSPAVKYSALPDGVTSFGASMATITSAGVRVTVSTTSSDLTVSAATADQCGGVLSGKVADSQALTGPLQGIVAKLYDNAGTPAPVVDGSGNPITATTNASGNYSFGTLKPGSYRVQFADVAGANNFALSGADVYYSRVNSGAWSGAQTLNYAVSKSVNSAAVTIVAGTPATVDAVYAVATRGVDDTALTGFKAPVTVAVAANDLLSSFGASLTSVKLCAGTTAPTVACNTSTQTLNAAEGVYTTSGNSIVFTPNASFAGTATGVYYWVVDNGSSFGATGAFARFTPTVLAAPAATNDTMFGDVSNSATVDPIANDTAAAQTALDQTSVRLCASSVTDPALCTLTSVTVASSGVNTLAGTYSVNTGSGIVSFAPTVSTNVGTAPAIKYVVKDAVNGVGMATIQARFLAIPPAITTSSLPNFQLGLGNTYSSTLLATAGTASTFATTKWTATGLPAGLTLNASTGALTGTPTTAGTYSITVTVTDSAGRSDSKTYSVIVGAGPTITNAEVVAPVGFRYDANAHTYTPWVLTNGSLVSFPMTASAGTFAIGTAGAWAISNATPNAHWSIDPNTGALSAAPTVGGWYAVTVTVTDVAGFTDTQNVYMAVNAGPVITTANITSSVGVVTSKSNTSTNAGVDLASNDAWSATGLPPGIMINPDSGIMSGTPAVAGTYSVSITATDKVGLTDTKTITWTVYAPPTITTHALPTIAVSKLLGSVGYIPAISVAAAAGSGAVKSSGAWTSSSMPAGLSFNATTGVISGTPATSGSYPITFTVTDTNNLTDTKTLTLVVASAPKVTTPADQPTATAGSPITPVIESYSLGLGVLPSTGAWSASGLPSGLTINPDTGVISGTVTRPGVYDITVTLTDSLGIPASKVITIPVYTAPTITQVSALPPQVVGVALPTTGAALTGVTVTTSAGSGDIGTGSWTCVGGVLSGTQLTCTGLPSGVTLNTNTGVLSGTPAGGTASATPYSFTVTVTDSFGLTATKTFTLTVGVRPTITATAPTQSYVVGTAIPALNPAATKGTADIPATGAYAATGLPAGLSINTNTGVISGTPTTLAGTPSSVTALTSLQGNIVITVTDAAGLTASTSNIPFRVNQAPSITTPDYKVQAGTAGSVTEVYTLGSAQLKATTWTISGNPAGVTINTSSGLISVANNTAIGTYDVTVSVQDQNAVVGGGANTQSLTNSKVIRIQVINGPTITTIPSGTVTGASAAVSGAGGSPYNFTYTISGTNNFKVGQYVTVIGSTPATYNVSQRQIIAVVGNTFTVTSTVTTAPAAWTSGGSVALYAFAPVAIGSSLTPISQTVTLGTGAIPATGAWSVVSDLTGASAGSLPAGLWLNPNNGEVMGLPVSAATSTVYLKVTDVNGLSDTEAYTVIVATGPSISTTSPLTPTSPDTKFVVGQAMTMVDLVDAQGTNALKTTGTVWTVDPTTPLPGGLLLNATSGNITGTPTTAGDFNVKVTVTDSVGLTATKMILITVLAKPTISTAADLGSIGKNVVASLPIVGVQGTASIPATGAYSCPSVCGLPAGLSLNADTGVITGTPTVASTVVANVPTPSTFTVKVTDTAGLFATKTFTLAIVATPPTITTSATLPSLVVGIPAPAVNQTVTVGTAAIPSLGAWSLDSSSDPLPTGLTLNPNTGQITGTPSSSASVTPHVFTLKVTDADGRVATKTFSVIIAAPPTITTDHTLGTAVVGAVMTPADLNATVGTSPTLVAWSVSQGTPLPAGLSIDPATGIISGTPAVGSDRAYSLDVTVTDAAGLSDTDTFTLTVVRRPSITTASALGVFAVNAPITPVALEASAGTADIPNLGTVWTVSVLTPLPAGLRLDAVTGVISGTPTSASGAFSVNLAVTDAAGLTATKTFTGSVNSLPSISTTPLDWYLERGVAIDPLDLNATPGTASIPTTGTVWTLAQNTSLPAGLVLNPATGVISGTPTADGNIPVTVTVTDSAGLTDTKTYTLHVGTRGPTISNVLPPQVLRALVVGAPASGVNLTATAGFAPVGTTGTVWQIDPTTPLPNGLTLNAATGAITGTPTAVGKYNLDVTVTDIVGLSDEKTLLLIVAVAPTVTTADLSPIVSGTAINPITNTFTLGTARLPVTGAWSATNLPAGLVIDPDTGVITGTPTDPASSRPKTFTVSVTDRNGLTGSKTMSVLVSGPPSISTVSPLAKIVQGRPMSTVTFAATAFDPATIPSVGTVWQVKNGSALPAGLSLDQTSGELTGVPTDAAGSFSFILTVTDSNGLVGEKNFTVNVVVPPTITGATVVPAWISGATPASSAVNFQPTKTQGTASVTSSTAWTLNTGSTLPAGLSLNATTGALTGTPAASVKPGTFKFTLKLTDDDGLSDTEDYVFTVAKFGTNTTVLNLQPRFVSGIVKGSNPVSVPLVTPGSSSAGLPVTYSVAPASTCSFDAGTGNITLTGTGKCTVSATSGAGALKSVATQSFDVLQAIAANPDAGTDSPSGFALNAATSSGLDLGYESLDPTMCAVDDQGIVTWLNPVAANRTEVCRVKVTQGGDGNTLPAERIFNVSATHSGEPPATDANGALVSPAVSASISRGQTPAAGTNIKFPGGALTLIVTDKLVSVKPWTLGSYVGLITADLTITIDADGNTATTNDQTTENICPQVKFGQYANLKRNQAAPISDPTRNTPAGKLAELNAVKAAFDLTAFWKKYKYNTMPEGNGFRKGSFMLYKKFTDSITCKLSATQFAAYKAGKVTNIVAMVVRDRRWPGTYSKWTPRNQFLYSTKVPWKLNFN